MWYFVSCALSSPEILRQIFVRVSIQGKQVISHGNTAVRYFHCLPFDKFPAADISSTSSLKTLKHEHYLYDVQHKNKNVNKSFILQWPWIPFMIHVINASLFQQPSMKIVYENVLLGPLYKKKTLTFFLPIIGYYLISSHPGFTQLLWATVDYGMCSAVC